MYKVYDSPYYVGDIERSKYNYILLIYVLYLTGFFTGITALIGVIFAYKERRSSVGIYRDHFDRQIRLFVCGVMVLSVIAVLHLLVLGLGVVTAGLGLIFMFVPWALTLAWSLGTLWIIICGIYACMKRVPIFGYTFF